MLWVKNQHKFIKIELFSNSNMWAHWFFGWAMPRENAKLTFFQIDKSHHNRRFYLTKIKFSKTRSRTKYLPPTPKLTQVFFFILWAKNIFSVFLLTFLQYRFNFLNLIISGLTKCEFLSRKRKFQFLQIVVFPPVTVFLSYITPGV